MEYPDHTWAAKFSASTCLSESGEKLYGEVSVFENLEEAYNWCKSRIYENQRQRQRRGGGSPTEDENPDARHGGTGTEKGADREGSANSGTQTDCATGTTSCA